MGKKRAAAAPVFPFPAADHFSDYGFDTQLVHFLFSSQPETKRSSTRRHLNQPPPLESARFRLQNPISTSSSNKKHRTKQQQRRRWWSSAASAALVLFKRQSSPSSSRPNPAAAGAARPAPASYAAGPLYFADADDDAYGNDDSTATSCACWAPSAAIMRSGHLLLAAAELGAASAASVPYVSLRNANYNLARGTGAGTAGGAAAPPPAMPIYLVT